jgi:hypothetical protein
MVSIKKKKKKKDIKAMGLMELLIGFIGLRDFNVYVLRFGGCGGLETGRLVCHGWGNVHFSPTTFFLF